MKCSFILSSIDPISFGSRIINLNEEWCECTKILNKILLSPENKRLQFVDDKFLLNKSNENKEDFDVLALFKLDFDDIMIPLNITKISNRQKCFFIRSVESISLHDSISLEFVKKAFSNT